MKTFRLAVVLGCALALVGFASAQSVDAYFGLDALMASHTPEFAYLGGGAYLNFGGDVIFFHGLGVGAEVALRAARIRFYLATAPPGYQAPETPLFVDFNLVWEPAPHLKSRVAPVIEAGIGSASFRYYEPFNLNAPVYCCEPPLSGFDASSANHLMLHLGIGANFYVTSHVFIRSMLDVYQLGTDNEFGTGRPWQLGASIGYTSTAPPQ
ncbi:MAG: hypothetical protein ACRD2E_07815 [Terriglobales bacterium]